MLKREKCRKLRVNFPTAIIIFVYVTDRTCQTCAPLDGLYLQVPLYINYYNVSLGWSLYTGSTVHQPLQCVPRVVFICRFHSTSTTTVSPLGGPYIQVPLYVYTIAVGSQITLLTAAISNLMYVLWDHVIKLKPQCCSICQYDNYSLYNMAPTSLRHVHSFPESNRSWQ